MKNLIFKFAFVVIGLVTLALTSNAQSSFEYLSQPAQGLSVAHGSTIKIWPVANGGYLDCDDINGAPPFFSFYLHSVSGDDPYDYYALQNRTGIQYLGDSRCEGAGHWFTNTTYLEVTVYNYTSSNKSMTLNVGTFGSSPDGLTFTVRPKIVWP